jgi:hypothetical protein
MCKLHQKKHLNLWLAWFFFTIVVCCFALFSFGHYIARPSIYSFQCPLWYLQTFKEREENWRLSNTNYTLIRWSSVTQIFKKLSIFTNKAEIVLSLDWIAINQSINQSATVLPVPRFTAFNVPFGIFKPFFFFFLTKYRKFR